MNPSASAAPGCVLEALDWLAGAAETMPVRQLAQYSAPPTSRVHSGQSALPHCRQYPVAVTSVWTAQFMEDSWAFPPKRSRFRWRTSEAQVPSHLRMLDECLA